MRPASGAIAVATALGLAACDALLTEPASVGPQLDVQLALVQAPLEAPAAFGDLHGGFQSVRTVQLRFIHDGSQRDTIVAAESDDTSVRARVLLHPDEARGWLEVQAELQAYDGRALFRGQGLVEAQGVSSVARVGLTPVAFEIEPQRVPRLLAALGDTAALVGRALFSTGQTIEGAIVTWGSLDPAIVEVISGNRAVSRSNGSTFITASSLGATDQFPVEVRQEPVVFTGVGPADTTVAVGSTFEARPFGADGNGFPLLPGASLQWTAQGGGVVAVGAHGLVTAVGAGTGTVTASWGSDSYDVHVTVTP